MTDESMSYLDALKEIKRLKEALEQQPCDDCISRQAVLEIIEKEPFKGDAISEVEKLPSLTPKEKTRHWTRVTDKTGHLVWECGCGWQQRFATNFCPDCGCHMFEPQESEGKEE